jgi:hypothetical protein
MLEVDERILRPEPLAKLVARHHFAGLLDQHREHLQGLLLEAEAVAGLSQLARASIELVDVELDDARCEGPGFAHEIGTDSMGGESVPRISVASRDCSGNQEAITRRVGCKIRKRIHPRKESPQWLRRPPRTRRL